MHVRTTSQTSIATKIQDFSKSGLVAAFLLFGVYLAITSLRPLNSFWSIDGGGKFIYMVSTIMTGDLFAPIIYPQRLLDENINFVPIFYRIVEGDQFYTWWSPFLPLLSIPFYKLFGNLGLYILPALSGAFCAYFSAKITQLLINQHGAAWLVFAVVAFTTPIAFYSQMFWEHTLSVALLLISLYCILKANILNKVGWAFFGGAVGSLAAAFRPESAIILAGFGVVWLFKDWRKAMIYGVSFVTASLPWMGFNYVQSGNLLYPSMDQFTSAPTLGQINRGGVAQFFSYLLFNAPIRYGFAISKVNLLVAGAGVLLSVVPPFVKKLRWLVLPGYLAVAWTSFQLLSEPAGYRAVHGFILIAPVVLLSVWLFVKIKPLSDSFYSLLLLGGLAAMGAAYVLKSWEAAGGLQWGPRYLLVFYPLLSIAAGVGLSKIWADFSNPMRSSLIACTLLFMVLGLGYEFRGIDSVRQTAFYADASEKAALQINGKPMLLGCDANTLMPELYWQKPVFSILRSNLEIWNDHLASIGINSYYQVEFDLCLLNQMDEIKAYREENPSGIIVQDCDVTRYQNHEEGFCHSVSP